jgi:hypothetical protein
MGGVEVPSIKYSHCIIIANGKTFEELDEASFVFDLSSISHSKRLFNGKSKPLIPVETT